MHRHPKQQQTTEQRRQEEDRWRTDKTIGGEAGTRTESGREDKREGPGEEKPGEGVTH